MQILANSLVTASVIALVAMSFSVVIQTTKVFHLALGGIIAVAPFLVLTLTKSGMPMPIAVALSGLVCALLSLSCELLLHRRLSRLKAAEGTHLIGSLGLAIVITQATVLAWGNETKVLGISSVDTHSFAGVALSSSQLTALAVSIVTLLVVLGFLQYTPLGLAFRAAASNASEAALAGLNQSRVRNASFLIAGGLAGLGSILMVLDVGFTAQGGLATLLLGVTGYIVGGSTSWLGPVVGAIVLAMLRGQAGFILGARWQDAVTFGVLALVLVLRPQGLLAPRRRLEAN